MAVRHFLTVPRRIGGQWRAAGDEIDTTGWRRGAIEALTARGLIYTDSEVAEPDPEPEP
jgi:hypothetical protein